MIYPDPIRDEYLDSAVYFIENKVKRAEVRQELLCHIEDAAEYHMSQGMTRSQAVEKALNEMGSADALSVQLKELYPHSPADLLFAPFVFLVCDVVWINSLILFVKDFAPIGPSGALAELLTISFGAIFLYLSARRGQSAPCIGAAILAWWGVMRAKNFAFGVSSLLNGTFHELGAAVRFDDIEIVADAYAPVYIASMLIWAAVAIITVATMNDLREPWRSGKMLRLHRAARTAALTFALIVAAVDIPAYFALKNVSPDPARTVYEEYCILEYDAPVPTEELEKLDRTAVQRSHRIAFGGSGHLLVVGNDGFFSVSGTVTELEPIPYNESIAIPVRAGEAVISPTSAYVAMIPKSGGALFWEQTRWVSCSPGATILLPDSEDEFCSQYARITICPAGTKTPGP